MKSGRRHSAELVLLKGQRSRFAKGLFRMKKSQIEQVVSKLPETVDVDALIERLHLLDKIEQAEKQLARGEGVSHEKAKQRMSQWLQ